MPASAGRKPPRYHPRPLKRASGGLCRGADTRLLTRGSASEVTAICECALASSVLENAVRQSILSEARQWRVGGVGKQLRPHAPARVRLV